MTIPFVRFQESFAARLFPGPSELNVRDAAGQAGTPTLSAVGLHRGIDGSEPIRIGADEIAHQEHRIARSTVVAVGTLACPSCDAPVALGGERVAPPDPLYCPFCDHQGPSRDFLSLDPPVRPTRVAVRSTAQHVSPSRV